MSVIKITIICIGVLCVVSNKYILGLPSEVFSCVSVIARFNSNHLCEILFKDDMKQLTEMSTSLNRIHSYGVKFKVMYMSRPVKTYTFVSSSKGSQDISSGLIM